MTERTQLSDEDIALFREAVGPVVRVEHDRVQVRRQRPRPHPRQTLADRKRVLEESLLGFPDFDEAETGEELLFVRPGLQHRLLRKLRRGQFSIGAELDLHGMTAACAQAALAEFLKDCRARRIRGVRIIHGKGLRSPQGRPVLKGKLDRWLRMRDEVVAFCSARSVDGGTGAVYVLLKHK